jgi:putative peptidoglycan lipid II flippase
MRAALLMSAGTLMSRILGLLRDVVLAAFFSRTVTDAFVVAFSFPNKFRRLLGEGSLSVSFIPIYVEARELDSEQASQLKNGIFTWLCVVSSILCVLGILFMDQIMGWLVGGSGYVSIEGKLELTIYLAKIMFSYLFLITTYAFGMAILNAHKQFFIAAMAPALFNLIFIVCALLPFQTYTPGIQLAWAVLLGGAVQALIVFYSLWKQNLLPRWTWRWKTPKVQHVLKNMVPGILGMGVLQLLTLVNTNYASRLQEGAHSYIYWADRILELPQSLIAISIGAALLPTLSELYAKGLKKEMLMSGQQTILTMLFLTLPSALGMYLLSQPIVEVLYLRGSFSAQDAASTAQVVRAYSILLIALSLNKVLVPNFYALKNTWLPAITSVVSVLIHIVVGYYFVSIWGLLGLVTSMTISGYINFFLTLYFYQKFVGPLDYMYLGKGLFKFFIPLFALGVSAYFIFYGLMEFSLISSESLQRAVVLILSISISGGLYFIFSHWLKVPQAQTVWSRIKKRRKKIAE